MNPVSAIAMSGLTAATLRLQASASNIANARSSGPLAGAANPSGQPSAYTPLDVRQTPHADGGVEASLAPASRDALVTYDPSAPCTNAEGMVATPNVNLVDDMIGLVTARYAFAANLAVLRTDADMQDAALGLRA